MKIKRKGNQILSADIADPTVELAEFATVDYELTERAKDQFVTDHNHGSDMLLAYAQGRYKTTLSEAAELLQRLDGVYHQHATESYISLRRERLGIDK